jgi:magnesium-transporting ATPase (P-type)
MLSWWSSRRAVRSVRCRTERPDEPPRAFVIRDGARLRIPGAEIVAGDIVVLDAIVLVATDLEADE